MTTVIVLLLGLVGTVVAFGLAGWWAARRLRVAYRDARTSLGRLEPALEQLDRQAVVTRAELARVEASLEALREQRERRRANRDADGPPPAPSEPPRSLP